MTVLFHKNFEKDYRKLRESEKDKFKERLALFLRDPFNPLLNNHPLKGKYQNYFSINITGDLRAIYKVIKSNIVIFITIGTHSKLYSS